MILQKSHLARPTWPGCVCQDEHTRRDYVNALLRASIVNDAVLYSGALPEGGYTPAFRLQVLKDALHGEEQQVEDLPQSWRDLDADVVFSDPEMRAFLDGRAEDEDDESPPGADALHAAMILKESMQTSPQASEVAEAVLRQIGVLDLWISDIAAVHGLRRRYDFGRRPLEARASLSREVRESFNAQHRQWVEAFEEMQQVIAPLFFKLGNQSDDQQPKQQHYLPRFWLEGFADNGNASVVDVTGPRAKIDKNKGVSAIASEKDYYTLRSADGEPDYWVENYFGLLEDQATNPGRWTNLAAGEMVSDPLGRLFVAQILVLQMFRGPSFRASMKTLAEAKGYDIVAMGQATGEIPVTHGALQIEASSEWLTSEMAAMAADHEQPRRLFLRHWGLYETPDETGWALPMEPVIGMGGTPPLMSPVIYVPVNRRYLLSMSWNTTGNMPEATHAETMTEDAAQRVRQTIIEHAQRQPIAASRRLIVHPDDAGRWQGWCFGGLG